MPGASFYSGLPLAEQLRKFVDHHHDPRVRHINRDEAALLSRAIDELEAGVSRTRRTSAVAASWEEREHAYSTIVELPGADWVVQVLSSPGRRMTADSAEARLNELGEILAQGAASPRSAQLALNALALREIDSELSIAEYWAARVTNRGVPSEASLPDEVNTLLNGVLYQPAIAVENSPPGFEDLSTLLTNAAGGGAGVWVAVLQDQGITFAVLGGVFGVVLLNVASGVSTGLRRGLEERFYEWSRPKRDDTEGPGL